MIFILLTVLAFLLFAVYDLNSVIWNKKVLKCGFFAGCLLLLAATSGAVVIAFGKTTMQPLGYVCLLLAACSLALLIYTLFFALPFEKTYVENRDKPEVCSTGMYALCRHPGVLCLFGFYLFLWLALPAEETLIVFILSTVCCFRIYGHFPAFFITTTNIKTTCHF